VIPLPTASLLWDGLDYMIHSVESYFWYTLLLCEMLYANCLRILMKISKHNAPGEFQ
jgi:hypothetical protein